VKLSETTAPIPGPGHGLAEGKSVLVTAAAGTGIGFAAAQRFAAEGARLAISDRHERRLIAAADRIDNAGLGGTASIQSMTDEQWSSVLDVTLTSTFRTTRSVLRVMIPRGSGVIVNNASVIGWRAQEGQSHYAAAKAGVMALTRCSALDVAPHGIRVNAVAPSIAMHPHLAKVTSDELLEQLSKSEAFGRAAQPWEVANVMVFLASDYSSYMTGEVVSVSSQHA